MEEVKTAGSFQQEMLRSAARAARGGASLWSGGWIDFPAEIHSSPELASFYGKRASGRQSAQRGLGFPAEAGFTARETPAPRGAAASREAGVLPPPQRLRTHPPQ